MLSNNDTLCVAAMLCLIAWTLVGAAVFEKIYTGPRPAQLLAPKAPPARADLCDDCDEPEAHFVTIADRLLCQFCRDEYQPRLRQF